MFGELHSSAGDDIISHTGIIPLTYTSLFTDLYYRIAWRVRRNCTNKLWQSLQLSHLHAGIADIPADYVVSICFDLAQTSA